MKTLLINGSPRGKKSNSSVVLNQWLFEEPQKHQLINEIIKKETVFHETFEAEYYVLIFPLYVDSMPSTVKMFFEMMEGNQARYAGKKIGYIVHSGFPEAIHSRVVERYLKYFTSRMEMNYMGTVVMGGSESIQAAPPIAFKRKIRAFRVIGGNILRGEAFSDEACRQLAGKEKMSLLKMLLGFPRISDVYFNSLLKENQAYDKRFDRPYEREAEDSGEKAR